MSKLHYRLATMQDYEEVMALYGLFVENERRYVGGDEDSYKEVVEDPKAIFEVVEKDGKIVGFILYSVRHVVRYPKPIIEVEEFFVLEEYRRQKIGKQFMDRVFDYAKEHNCQYVFLASGKERPAAHGFYKNYGFDEYAFHYRKSL